MKASECKCIKCGKPAVAFWPCIDIDIPERPYCRACLDKAKLKAFISIFGEEQGKVWYKIGNEIVKRKNSKKKKEKPYEPTRGC